MAYLDEITRPEPINAEDEASSLGDDAECWVCAAWVIRRHGKVICARCGFTRDCSDP